MYVYIYIFIYTFSFWPQCYLFCNFCLFCGFVSLTRLTVSDGWRLLRFDKFMFWVKILSHIYPNFFICTVPFKFNLTSCIIFCMIILYRDLRYYIVFYILYYLYLGGFHASDSLSLNGSHPDMLFNLYFFSVICRINIFSFFLSYSRQNLRSSNKGAHSFHILRRATCGVYWDDVEWHWVCPSVTTILG